MIGVAAVVLAIAAGSMSDAEAARRLSAELASSATATAVLERRCAALGLADPPRVRAERVREAAPDPAPPSRDRLALKPGERVGYRRVRLMCGEHLLSDAENWYVIGRLSAEMNAALDSGDAPFGRVILPLRPHRRTLAMDVARPGRALPEGAVVRHHAMVLDGQGRPLAEVVERYQPVLLGQASGGVSLTPSRSPSN